MAKKRINNELGATVFAILVGLAALLLVNWIFGMGGCKGDATDRVTQTQTPAAKPAHSKKEEPKTAPVSAAPPLTAVNQARDASGEEAARRTELASEVRDAKLANAELSKEMATLKSKVAGHDELLKKRDTEIKELNMALSNGGAAQKELKAAKEALAKQKVDFDTALKQQEASAKKLAATMNAEKPADSTKLVAELKGQITSLEQKLKGLGGEKTKLTAAITAKDAEIAKIKASGNMAAGADASLKKLQIEFAASKKSIIAKDAEIAKLQASGKMAAGGDAKLKKLEAELAALKKSSAEKEKNCQTQQAKLSKEIADLKKQLADALAKVTEMKTAIFLKPASDLPGLDLPLLVNDPNKLNPEFKPPFIRLREMADNTTAREKVYAEVAKEGKFQVLLRVPFQNASAYVSGEFQGKIKELVKNAGKGSKFLVVGYASTDGSADSNQKLSSQRASNVAQQISDGADSNTQAVYFGQTSRFSAELPPNRVVEVWQIK